MPKKIILGILLSVLIIGQFSVVSKASEYYEFYVNCSEPATSPSQGYIVLILRNVGSGELVPTTFFWNTMVVVSASGEQSASYCDISVSNSGNTGTVEFAPAGHLTTPASALYTLYEVQTNGTFHLQKHSSSERFRFTWQGYNIVNYKLAGNGYMHGFNANQNYLCNVYFNSDNVSMLLMELQATLSRSQGISQDILNRVNSIVNSVDEVEGKLNSAIDYLRSVDSELDSIRSELQLIYQKSDAILLEQKQTNSLLDKILEHLEEKNEKDKQEASSQGNSSVSQSNDAIDNKGEGFKNSLGGLVSKMNYSGTDCSWQFPEVRLPQIDGVMDSKVLIRSQEIDFGQWINAIPSGILLLVQSLLTVALIVYCFKEFYGTIEYVLTMRKGGMNDE